MSSSDDSPSTKSERFFEMAKMTAGAAGNYASSRFKAMFQDEDSARDSKQSSDEKTGQLIADTLGDLKGAAMKVGQMLSLTEDLLPPELKKPLKKLQNEAPPMSYEVIAKQVESELGETPELLFDEFEKEPFASASIGQVHRAVTDDGRSVAVKIQYPAVDQSVDSDLDQFWFALKLSGLIESHQEEAFENLLEELKDRLHEELDYTNEATNVRVFQDMYEDTSWLVVPDVVGERSSKRVLTLTYEDGDNLQTVADTYPQQTRNKIGERVVHMLTSQLLEHATLHADPNAANYAFRENGDIVLYDYGCIRSFTPSFMETYAELLRCAVEPNLEPVDDLLFELGARTDKGPDVPLSLYEEWHGIMMQPFFENEYFDYGASTIHKDVSEKVSDTASKYRTSFQPVPELALIDRTGIGLYHNLREIGAVVPWKSILEEYLDNFDPDELTFPAPD